MVKESVKYVVESVSEQKLGEELNTEPWHSKIECNSNEGPTPEDDITDLDDYSFFVQGISNRSECYDLDQRHETREAVDTCVKHTLSYQSETDDSEIDDSDLYWKNYPISPRDSALIKLDLLLTESERSLIDEFRKELKDVVKKNDQGYRDKHENFANTALERIECITNKYLQKGIRLNSKYNDDKYTITSLIFKEIRNIPDRIRQHKGLPPYESLSDDSETITSLVSKGIRDTPAYEGVSDDKNIGIIRNIMSNLLLKGGRVKCSSFYDDKLLYATYGFSYEIFAECEEIDNKLKSVADEGIINSSAQGKSLHVEMDNGYFYVKYSQDSTVEVAKVINNPKVKDLSFRHHIFHIGKSIVRVENVGGKRNYTDVLEGGIEMSFTTEVGKISIHLRSSDKDNNKIEVKISDDDKKKLDQLKDKEEIGENCLLGGYSVHDAIKRGYFEKHETLRQSSEEITLSNEKKKNSWCEIVTNSNELKQEIEAGLQVINKKHHELIQENQRLQEKLETTQAEANQTIVKLEKQNSDLQDRFEKEEQKNTELQTELAQKNEELAGVLKELQGKVQELKSVYEEKRKLKEELKIVNAGKKNLEKELNQAREDAEQIMVERCQQEERLKDQLRELDQEYKVQVEIEQKIKESDRQDSDLQDTLGEERLKLNIEELEDEYEEFSGDEVLALELTKDEDKVEELINKLEREKEKHKQLLEEGNEWDDELVGMLDGLGEKIRAGEQRSFNNQLTGEISNESGNAPQKKSGLSKSLSLDNESYVPLREKTTLLRSLGIDDGYDSDEEKCGNALPFKSPMSLFEEVEVEKSRNVGSSPSFG